jgi:hypothetical protein
MANMGYCRFENTFRDLEDCDESLESKPFDEMSESEQKYALYLIELCGEIFENNSHLLEKKNKK